LLVALIGCAGSGDGGSASKAHRASDAGAGDAAMAAASCARRCAPDESHGPDCRCTQDGARMRLGDLADDFYAQPWPLVTRLSTDGSLDLTGYPTAAGATFVRNNLALLAKNTHGFGTNGALFASFDGALDPHSLPAAAQDSLAKDSAVVLLDIDGSSPDRGERTPIVCDYKNGASDYHPAHFLACLPVPGFPLRPDTLYALYFTDALHAADRTKVAASQRWQDVLEARDGDAATNALIDAYAPLADQLRSDGVDPKRVVGGSVFRTQDPVAQMKAIAAHVQTLDAPGLEQIAEYGGTLPADANFAALQGSYRAPIYQQGQTPYATAGGEIRFTSAGNPVVAGQLSLRFGLTIPKDEPMPEAGWPLVLYSHGTGGSAFSFIDDGSAARIAAAGVATLAIDAPVHGPRNPGGSDPSLLFFNVNNLLALRDNVRQGAADLLVLERFARAMDLTSTASPTGHAIRFDPERIFAMGHSQGALTTPLMAAVSERVKGAMLSGAGASITMTLLYKTQPIDIPQLTRQYLALPSGEHLDAFHPVLALVQAFTEVADSSNYVPYFYRWQGGHGLDVWVTQGLLDKEVPPPATDALITAIGVNPLQPLQHEVEGLGLRQLAALPAPLRANVMAVDGERYTAAYSQYPDDGHFAIFDNQAAQLQLTHWFDTLAHQGRAELIAP
jgi:predicted esterase